MLRCYQQEYIGKMITVFCWLLHTFLSSSFFFFNDDNYRLLTRFKFNHAILYTGFINHIIYLNHDNSLDLET